MSNEPELSWLDAAIRSLGHSADLDALDPTIRQKIAIGVDLERRKLIAALAAQVASGAYALTWGSGVAEGDHMIPNDDLVADAVELAKKILAKVGL